MKSYGLSVIALLGSVLLCQCSKEPEVFKTPAGYSKPISLQQIKAKEESWQKKALAIMSLAVEPTAHAASTTEELRAKKVAKVEKRGKWAPVKLSRKASKKSGHLRSKRHLTLK